MMRRLLHRAATPIARRAAVSLLAREPELAVELVGPRLTATATFGTASLPDGVSGFEDLAFLFSSNPLNMGIAALAIDEAAHLYRTVRVIGAAKVAEIGRFKGGSTFLFASAVGPGGAVWSYDLNVKLDRVLSGPALDEELRAGLREYGFEDRVHLIVGDSRTAPLPPDPCDVVFVDGDHEYDGVRADYERWRDVVRPGGHLIFHDAVATRVLATEHEGVARVVAEIEREDPELERMPAPGSLAHFMRLRSS